MSTAESKESENTENIELASQAVQINYQLTIKDTDFLLRLIAMSPIDGRELEQAFETKNKITELHKILSEVTI